MARSMWTTALALGAVLAIGGSAGAQENLRLGGNAATPAGISGGTMTLNGGVALADAPATAADGELTRYGRHHGGYGRYHGGYGRYHGGYGGRYYGGYGGRYYGGYCGSYGYGYGYSCYRPYCYNSCYSGCYNPCYYNSCYSYCSTGGAADASATTMTLSGSKSTADAVLPVSLNATKPAATTSYSFKAYGEK